MHRNFVGVFKQQPDASIRIGFAVGNTAFTFSQSSWSSPQSMSQTQNMDTQIVRDQSVLAEYAQAHRASRSSSQNTEGASGCYGRTTYQRP